MKSSFSWLPANLLVAGSAFTLSSSAAEQTPERPSPLHGATAVSSSIVLSWTTGRDNVVMDGGFEGPLGTSWDVQTLGTVEVRTQSQSGPYSGGGAMFIESIGSSGHAEISQRIYLPLTSGPLQLSWAAAVSSSLGLGFAYYQVELRDQFGAILDVVFDWRRLTLGQPWDRYVADLSKWRGQDVTLAFLADIEQPTYNADYWLGLDDIRIGSESFGETFEVYLGQVESLDISHRLGQTRRAQWPLRGLRAGRHFWQVISVVGDRRVSGPVWSFTVLGTGRRPGTVDWILPEPPLDLASPAPLSLLGVDPYGHPLALGGVTVALAAEAPDMTPASIVISEVSVGPTNAVEFMNVSPRDVNLVGWRLQIVSGSGFRGEFVFPEASVARPGEVFHVHAGGPLGEHPAYGMTNFISFGSGIHFPDLVGLYDVQTNLIDLFAASPIPISAQTFQPRPALTDWQWPNVRGYSDADHTWQRVGFQDRNRALDWRSLPRTLGAPNLGIRTNFAAGPGRIAITPELVTLLAQSLVTNIQFSVPAPEVVLLAEAPAGNLGVALRSNPFSVLASPPLQLEILAEGKVRFFGKSGQLYRLETAEDLRAPWQPHVQSWSGADAIVESDPFTASTHPLFLRVKMLP